MVKEVRNLACIIPNLWSIYWNSIWSLELLSRLNRTVPIILGEVDLPLRGMLRARLRCHRCWGRDLGLCLCLYQLRNLLVYCSLSLSLRLSHLLQYLHKILCWKSIILPVSSTILCTSYRLGSIYSPLRRVSLRARAIRALNSVY
jgi:hypothetical protein